MCAFLGDYSPSRLNPAALHIEVILHKQQYLTLPNLALVENEWKNSMELRHIESTSLKKELEFMQTDSEAFASNADQTLHKAMDFTDFRIAPFEDAADVVSKLGKMLSSTTAFFAASFAQYFAPLFILLLFLISHCVSPKKV